jgi:hypothetical protein
MSVRHALLALLSEGPKYGLQLGQEFEARTGDVWPLNMGQVYTTARRRPSGSPPPVAVSSATGCGLHRTRPFRLGMSW